MGNVNSLHTQNTNLSVKDINNCYCVLSKLFWTDWVEMQLNKKTIGQNRAMKNDNTLFAGRLCQLTYIWWKTQPATDTSTDTIINHIPETHVAFARPRGVGRWVGGELKAWKRQRKQKKGVGRWEGGGDQGDQWQTALVRLNGLRSLGNLLAGCQSPG